VQLGPKPPSNTSQTEQPTTSDDGSSTDLQTHSTIDQSSEMQGSTADTATEQTSQPSSDPETDPITGEIIEGSTGESFFQTWMNGQENPIVPSMLFLMGILLALIVLMRALRRSSSKRKLQTHTMGQPSERIEKLNRQAHVSMDPAQRAVVEAEDLTRRMGAVLDNKAAKIEILLQEANQRIEQLERASKEQLTQAQQTHHSAPDSVPESRGVPPEALDRARLDQDRAERTPESSTSSSEDAQPTYRFERGPMERSSAQPDEAIRPSKPMTFPEQVDELVVQGLNAMEIANKLNRPVGEVELVLNLRRNSG
jgi:preprotein translocase subunit SecG